MHQTNWKQMFQAAVVLRRFYILIVNLILFKLQYTFLSHSTRIIAYRTSVKNNIKMLLLRMRSLSALITTRYRRDIDDIVELNSLQ